MLKYAITHTVKNDVTILGLFDTIEEARAHGSELARTVKGGIVVLISADFDEKGNRTNNKEWVYEAFNP